MSATGTPARTRAQIRDLLGSRRLEHVVVLGANGTMGYGSGALFTTTVPRVTFLARSKDKAEQGLAAAVKAVRSGTVRNRVETGDYGADFDRAVPTADLIFESLTEDFEVKQQMFDRVDKARHKDSIVATVTSGLSINKLAEGRSDSFKKQFLGLHFFNPPNVIVGTELVVGRDTDPGLADFIEVYCEKKLGRVMIRTSDTPGFAGNRVGFKVLNEAAQLAEERGPLLVDRLVGPYTGRALPPLATVDLVGWDIHKAIVDNIYKNTTDEAHGTLKLPAFMDRLIASGTLGDKSGRGFFKTDGKTSLVLDPKTGDYRPTSEVRLPDLRFINEVATHHHNGRYSEGMKVFLEARGDEAALARKVFAGYISYAFHRAGEVTRNITGIDLIMGFGFNWAPPSVLVDLLGVRETVTLIDKAGLPVPKVLAEAASSGQKTQFFNQPQVNRGRFFVAG